MRQIDGAQCQTADAELVMLPTSTQREHRPIWCQKSEKRDRFLRHFWPKKDQDKKPKKRPKIDKKTGKKIMSLNQFLTTPTPIAYTIEPPHGCIAHCSMGFLYTPTSSCHHAQKRRLTKFRPKIEKQFLPDRSKTTTEPCPEQFGTHCTPL